MAEAIAYCEHDLYPDARLFAYRPERDPLLHQSDLLARHTFGTEVSSPLTPYMAVWRHELATILREPGPPAGVFLTCLFGTDPWQSPRGLEEHADERNLRAEAVVRINWTRRDGDYVIDRLDTEIRGIHQSGFGMFDRDGLFRSHHRDQDLRGVSVHQGRTHFPQNGADDFAFNLRLRVRENKKGKKEADQRIINLTLAGKAVPIPDWVNY